MADRDLFRDAAYEVEHLAALHHAATYNEGAPYKGDHRGKFIECENPYCARMRRMKVELLAEAAKGA